MPFIITNREGVSQDEKNNFPRFCFTSQHIFNNNNKWDFASHTAHTYTVLPSTSYFISFTDNFRYHVGFRTWVNSNHIRKTQNKPNQSIRSNQHPITSPYPSLQILLKWNQTPGEPLNLNGYSTNQN